jgi:hypothetical protein
LAKLLCGDLNDTKNGVKGFKNYDVRLAEHELRLLRKWYIRITGSPRGFPIVVQVS